MKVTKSIVASLLLATTVISCATLQLSPEAEKIRVLSPDEISSCREVGKANASVPAVLLGIDRPLETLSKELQMVARNSAATMGGDTIVALTVIDEGKQTFVVYKCVNPNG